MISRAEGCNPLCPACSHRDLPIEESRNQKEEWLKKKLLPWKDLLAPLRYHSSVNALHYRDKVCLATVWNGRHWLVGTKQNLEVVPIHDCPVHSGRVRKTLHILLEALPEAPVFPMVYFAQSGAQVTLVLKTRELPGLGWLTGETKESLSDVGVEGLWIHLHPSAGNRVFLKTEWRLVWGTGSSKDDYGFLYGPASFHQLIPALHLQALKLSEEFLAPGPGTLLADLYCGNGVSLNRWVTAGAAAIGVELAGEAAAFAAVNAPGAEVLRGTCGQRIPQLNRFVEMNADRSTRLLYANPPRTGLEQTVLDWISAEFRPSRIAYLSCSAGTLERDLELIERSGYVVQALIPLDFFPYTRHVETLAFLQRTISRASG